MAIIKKATESDIQDILPLVKEYWDFENIDGFEPERVSVQLRRLLTEPSIGGGWIAMDDGGAAGYLLAVYVFSLEHLGLTAEIDEFFMLPSHRGLGIGKKLLMAAEAEFFRIGCTNVSLQLSRKNESARNFYHHFQYLDRSGYELLDKTLRRY